MLSRKILKLQATNQGMLSYDWNYSVGKILYNKMTLYNEDYAKNLHDEGFRSEDKLKKFKLFNFALTFIEQEFKKDGIVIKEGNIINLSISGKDEIINAILQGLILDNEFNIDNIIFKFVGIERNEKVKFNKINIYRAMTPVVESIWNNGVNYLNPYQIEYYNAIKQNLKRKYALIYGEEYQGILKIMIENMLKVKEKSFSIKNGYIHGYGKFEIVIQAEKNMQKIAYYCGVGEKNSMGAGFLKYLTGGE